MSETFHHNVDILTPRREGDLFTVVFDPEIYLPKRPADKNGVERHILDSRFAVNYFGRTVIATGKDLVEIRFTLQDYFEKRGIGMTLTIDGQPQLMSQE